MQQQTIKVEKPVVAVAENVPGDLRVAGWDRLEIMAKTDGDDLEITTKKENLQIKCDGDLILYLPSSSSLKFDTVSGDASVQALKGMVDLGDIAGDLVLHDVGAVNVKAVAGNLTIRQSDNVIVQSISGNLVLRKCKADCQITSVGGDASVRDVEGSVEIKNVGSDLFLRNVRGNVDVTTGADATLYLKPQADNKYNIHAGDDILLRLPSEVDAKLHLRAGSPESLNVDFADVELDPDKNEQTITIGNGSAQLYLTANDDLLVTSKSKQWDSAVEFGIDMGEFEWPHIPEIPPVPPLPSDFHDRINERIQRAMERAQRGVDSASRHAERAKQHAEAASRRAELRMEAAMRRAEAKMRAAEKRMRGSVVIGGSRVFSFSGPSDEQKTVEPISEEERLMILNMLQEKKISVEEAENLLAALEGRKSEAISDQLDQIEPAGISDAPDSGGVAKEADESIEEVVEAPEEGTADESKKKSKKKTAATKAKKSKKEEKND